MKKYKPKKSLGQNFLQDEKALVQILAAADLSENDNVLEIGPGRGALSVELMKNEGGLIMVEKDAGLVEEMARNFKFEILNFQSISNDQIYNFKNRPGIISGDILEINLPKLIEENDFFDYKVVANIPYYITGKIVRLLLETKYVPRLIVLLVQKEVAERICAKPGDMSVLSVTAQFFGECEIVDFVSRESFSPVPKVDSAIIKISPFENNSALRDESKQLFPIVKMGFASRRKTLLNNIASGLQISKQVVKEILQTSSLEENVRAQNLSVEQWKTLAHQVQGHSREEQK